LENTPEMRKIVVICPVKNESWILSTFLDSVSKFADHIIIGDHFSTDDSREIAASFPKVHLLRASKEDFSEADRRNELLVAARLFGDNNLIISLDADELLTPNFWNPKNLEVLKSKPVGTRFSLSHLNVLPGWKKYWAVPMAPIAFIDDGDLHDTGLKIHFPRIPNNSSERVINLPDCGIIHLQYVDWGRMESKHAWYRVWERINFPKKSQLEIFRRYSHMYFVPEWRLRPVPQSWLEEFRKTDIDVTKIGASKSIYWWDEVVEKLISDHPRTDFSLLRMADGDEETRLSPLELSFRKYIKRTSLLAKYSWILPVRLLLRVIDRINSKRFA
jgi:glycosyltransferase involved in cell wall biosynthesis